MFKGVFCFLNVASKFSNLELLATTVFALIYSTRLSFESSEFSRFVNMGFNFRVASRRDATTSRGLGVKWNSALLNKRSALSNLELLVRVLVYIYL